MEDMTHLKDMQPFSQHNTDMLDMMIGMEWLILRPMGQQKMAAMIGTSARGRQMTLLNMIMTSRAILHEKEKANTKERKDVILLVNGFNTINMLAEPFHGMLEYQRREQNRARALRLDRGAWFRTLDLQARGTRPRMTKSLDLYTRPVSETWPRRRLHMRQVVLASPVHLCQVELLRPSSYLSAQCVRRPMTP